MEQVKNAVDTMIAGVLEIGRGEVWRNGYSINRSGDRFVEFELSESVLEMDEDKAIADAIYREVYDDLISLVNEKILEVGSYGVLKNFFINEARLMRGPIDEKSKRYTYELMYSYYAEVVNELP